jgi:hypothetical protein
LILFSSEIEASIHIGERPDEQTAAFRRHR